MDAAQSGDRAFGDGAGRLPRPEAVAFAPPEYRAGVWPVPSDADCLGFWDRYIMPEHIRRHSTLVGHVAGTLADMAQQAPALRDRVDPAEVRASGLLHDLAKAYTIAYGGQHAALGAAWVQALTGNPAIAQGVMHHVWWPWDADPTRHFLPLAVLYADKRVRHDAVASLGSRYSDLFERYGKTPEIMARIRLSLAQSRALEEALGKLLGVNLHACDFGGGRLVQ